MMIWKKTLLIVCATLTAMFGINTVASHAGQPEDSFRVETKEIQNRKKGPPKFELVYFTHEKHSTDYEIGCGDCHHDNENNPLALKKGDAVQRCVACHSIVEKTKENRQDIMVLENAMHGNCITCHKQVNTEAGDPKGMNGPAPATCSKCHQSAAK
mgnify:CR=1 FL=1